MEALDYPIDTLVTDYYQWLRAKTDVIADETTGWAVISTPFVGLFNDTIEIYIRRQNGKTLFSDDGQTLQNLELTGVSLSHSAKRREMVAKILLNFGLTLNDDKEFVTEATEKDFVQKKHNFVSAIAEINDLYVLAKPTVASIFKDDVKSYLDGQDIIITPQFISKGATGIEFTFDFQIAYRKKEVLIKAFNQVNKINLPNFLFSWQDVKEARERITEKEVVGLAIINDEDREGKPEYLDALKAKGAEYILWNQRTLGESQRKLAA